MIKVLKVVRVSLDFTINFYMNISINKYEQNLNKFSKFNQKNYRFFLCGKMEI